MISVCLATYNGERYIKEQIDSILIQLDENDELIISDDHSVDSTREIIKSYQDNRIKLYINPLSRGVSHNFENALQHATGEIIFLADQDDVWHPNKIKEMNLFLRQNGYDVVTCNCAVTDASLNIIQERYYITHSPINKSALGNLLKDLWLGCCMAFTRQVLTKTLPFPKHLIAHDLWIALYGQLYFKCGYYPYVRQLYRRHENNVSFANGQSQNNIWFKIKYRLYIAYHILYRYIKTKIGY